MKVPNRKGEWVTILDAEFSTLVMLLPTLIATALAGDPLPLLRDNGQNVQASEGDNPDIQAFMQEVADEIDRRVGELS